MNTEATTANIIDQQKFSKPIRVMHIIDKLGTSGSSIHGVTKCLAWWIPRFDPQCYQFSVCSLREPEAGGEALEAAGVKPYFLSRNKFDPRTIKDLRYLMEIQKPDVLHLHGFGAANFGRILTFFTGIPNIVHEHVTYFHQPVYQSAADIVLSPLTTKAIAVSQQVWDYVVKHRYIDSRKVEIVYNGLPLDEFKAPGQDVIRETHAALGIPQNVKVISTVGRLDTQKGQVYLLQAARLILKELPETRFLIVGDGPDRELLAEVARKEGVAGSVIFTGFRTDIPALLSITDVFAIPSIREGGPLTLFEAMSLCKPVVGTPTGLMPDFIRDGENGFLVPVADIESLAERLIFLLKNPGLAQEMGKKGWEICQQNDVQLSVQHLGKIYQEVVAEYLHKRRSGIFLMMHRQKFQ